MDIIHHGAINGVTGSCHELRLDSGEGILIDCGLFQGDEKSSDNSNDQELSAAIDFPIDHIKALIVTHVHIDHVGRTPYLLAAGFKGPIYCSEPSALLLPLVIEDALKIGFTRNERLIRQFMQQLKQQIQPVAYKQWQAVDDLEDRLSIKLQPAGHILGSAYVQCRLTENRSTSNVLFSGDLGAPHTPLLAAPQSPYGTDVLIIESTYGDRQHQNRRHRRQLLESIVERAVSDNGVVLIPAFSIGRTQELLYELESIIYSKPKSSLWQELEILVDSPLAARFTDAYRELKPYWDQEAHRHLKQGRHPLSFDQLYTIDSHKEHRDTIDYLQRRQKPCIVIAASGMCAGGRITNYLKAFIEDSRTDVLLVGYQARGTPGRALQQYGPENGFVMFDGQRFNINAQIHTLSGYSAHADQKDLINFVKRMRKKPSHIRIVHGDKEAKLTLQHKLRELCPEARIIIPG